MAVAEVTLHVGAGTFLPVTVDDIADHRMHSEWGQIGAETAARLATARAVGGRIIAVGTTSLRIMEACAAQHGRVTAFSGETDIFITPGFRFRAVDMLLTNFHLPKSTLLMLVAPFRGSGVFVTPIAMPLPLITDSFPMAMPVCCLSPRTAGRIPPKIG